jgi:GH18 family chitinase
MVTAAHAKNVKAGVAIGGWNDGNTGPFEAMAANPTSRAAFISNVIAMCDKYSLDGIDMDWEYPKAHSVANYTTMMKELSVELKKKNRYLSAAVISSGNGTGQYITKEVIDVLDYLNIMAYDAGGANHTSYNVGVTALDYWVTQRGTPKHKAILGLGFYGRDANGGSYTDYKVILQRDPLAYTKDQSGNLGYNGVPTIERKTQMAFDRAGGVMIWEISQDTHDDQTSLLRAINRKVKQFPTALRGPGAGIGMSAISMSAAPGWVRVSGAPAGMMTLRLRTVEGRVVFESPLLADARGAGAARLTGPAAKRGIYFASLEGTAGILSTSVLPIAK